MCIAFWLAVVTVVQLPSSVQIFLTPWTAACQASLSFTISQSLLKLKSTELVMPSNYLILYHPLLLLPSAFPRIRVFSNASALCIRWPKNWSFSFSISPSSEHSGFISLRIDWFDLLDLNRNFFRDCVMSVKIYLLFLLPKWSLLKYEYSYFSPGNHHFWNCHCMWHRFQW